MKRGFILLIALLGAADLGCRQEGPNEVGPKTVQAGPPARSVDARTADDGAAIVRTGNGTVTRKSGWQLPVTLPAEKQYDTNTLVVGGRHVNILNYVFLPEEKLVVRIPKLLEDGDVEYKVSQIIEFTDERKVPYCYQLSVTYDQSDIGNPRSGVPTVLSYRDDDGDGVFETLGEACKVPDWVK